MSTEEKPILPLSELSVELEHSQKSMIDLIRSEGRLINRFDPESPQITPEIEKITTKTLADLVNALVETKDLTREAKGGGRLSTRRRIIRCAMHIRELQEKLEQDETVRNYSGSHGNVLLTLTGTVTRHALDLTRRFGINGVVANDLVEELTGAAWPKGIPRHNGSAKRGTRTTALRYDKGL